MFRVLALLYLTAMALSACATPSARTTIVPTAIAAAPQPTATTTATPTNTPTAAPTARATPTAMPLMAVVPRSRSNCPVTTLFKGDAPRDGNADPVRSAYWYINADQTIWAGTVPEGGWAVGGNKMYWVRPAGTQLTITGRRLDGEAPPLHAVIPCCYPTGFQIVGLDFPTEGCWEVNAKAGDHELRFVTVVRPANPPATSSTCTTLTDAVQLSNAIVVGSILSSNVNGRYVWHDVALVEIWKPPNLIGDRFSLLQDPDSEMKLEKGKQYVLFIQYYTPWRLVCAQRSVIEKKGDQAIPLENNPLWSGGTIADLRKEIEKLTATR